jgi:hypothetical protein
MIYCDYLFSISELCILVRKFDTVSVRQLPHVLLCRVTLRALLRYSYNPTDLLIGHTCFKRCSCDTRFSYVYVMVSRIVCHKTWTVSTDMVTTDMVTTDMVTTIFMYEIYIKILFPFFMLFFLPPLHYFHFFHSSILLSSRIFLFTSFFFHVVLFLAFYGVFFIFYFPTVFASSLTYYFLPYFSYFILFHFTVLSCPFCW